MNTGRRFARAAVALWLLAGIPGPVGTAGGAEPPMVEKNLFAPDRKPVENKPSDAPAEAPKMQKGAIQLDGVLVRGDTRKAILKVSPGILKNQKGGQRPYITVGENEQVGDYRVTKIEPRSITLEMRGTTFLVPLFVPGKATTPAPKMPAQATVMTPGTPPRGPAQTPGAAPAQAPAAPPGLPAGAQSEIPSRVRGEPGQPTPGTAGAGQPYSAPLRGEEQPAPEVTEEGDDAPEPR
jgi:hypothetical protein